MKSMIRSLLIAGVFFSGLLGHSFAQGNVFLKIDGIPGEATANGHGGEIVLQSLSFGVDQVGIRVAGGRAAAGKSRFSVITVSKLTDKSSPQLFLKTALGQGIPTATITIQKLVSESPVDYLTIKLTDVFISGYSLSSGGDQPSESVSLSFSGIEYTYRPILPGGGGGDPITVRFDVNKNKGGAE